MNTYKVAIVGGGPSALFLFKRFVEVSTPVSITIYEKTDQLGAGMPYSTLGARDEHVTNVAANEIPTIVSSMHSWLESGVGRTAKRFNITAENFNEYRVLPRLFLGEYLNHQFSELLELAEKSGISIVLKYNTVVDDIVDDPAGKLTTVVTAREHIAYDHVFICTGHTWPHDLEYKYANYFQSPYPPDKIATIVNSAVAIRGSSLTAIDAIRTLARTNGVFNSTKDDQTNFTLKPGSENFRITLFSRNGLLPALRFHLDDTHLHHETVLSPEAIAANREVNEGFLSLDYIFEKNFKEPLRASDPPMFERIQYMNLEEFAETMMDFRNGVEPFQLFKGEYVEGEKSIRRKQSVHWKEMLAVLSFAMNYPAKHLSAEDMMRLQKVLMPLISVVIAFVPQTSARELIALNDAGVLEIVSVGDDNSVQPLEEGGAKISYTAESGEACVETFSMFIDCVGQRHLYYNEFPFKTLKDDHTVSPAMLAFRDQSSGEQMLKEQPELVTRHMDGKYYLNVPGIAINDSFQVLDRFGAANPRIYVMAVPLIGGSNPDYSGLDFGEEASKRIIAQVLKGYQYIKPSPTKPR